MDLGHRVTDHIVHSIPHLTTITFVINTIAHLPILETALVIHKSTVKQSETLILTGVLVFNLISISHLTKSLFCCFVFISNLCFIQDLTHWSMIGLGKEHGGLYFLQQDFKSDMFKSCPFNAWHYCLAIKMIFVWLVQFLSKKGFLFVILMLVLSSYTDLWGLFSIPTTDVFKFFLTIVDDYSKCTCKAIANDHTDATQWFLLLELLLHALSYCALYTWINYRPPWD